MTIILNSLSSKLLTSISLTLFPPDILFYSFVWNICLCLFIFLDSALASCALDETATSPSIEGLVLCRR